MFFDEELQNHLETSATIRINSFITAEWNMNIASNISKIGNYRYRPNETNKYSQILETYDSSDSGYYYTNATDADISITGISDNTNNLLAFTVPKDKEKLLYSLESCFSKFRPRSGINKLRYFQNSFTHHVNPNMMSRPRYYMGHKDDVFKYWSSYRTESDNSQTEPNPLLRKVNVERGIANIIKNNQFFIDDAAPFIVYKETIPTNRIIVKMQTNVGEADLGPFTNGYLTYNDPFFGDANKTTPVRWKIQGLRGESWVDLINFDQSSTRKDGSQVIKSDGYVEISYGLIVPEQYQDIFINMGSVYSSSLLPKDPLNGHAYLVKANEDDIGLYYIWIDSIEDYATFTPNYGWQLHEEAISNFSNFVTDLTNPPSFNSSIDGLTFFREFDKIRGLRIVVDTMNKKDSVFDLIELSPRLVVDISDKAQSFSINKSASDLGITGMPVGQLFASTGNLEIFDYDQAFNPNNSLSIVNKFLMNNIQVKFYEKILNVNYSDYYIPIKTMYSDGFPVLSNTNRQLRLELRDLMFYFESVNAPEVLIPGASLSYVLATIFDYIGFSNYTYKKVALEPEPIIPYFFIAPNTTVAEVLEQLAISTQTAMFFDEYNNFVCMSKNYIMPTESERPTDVVLYGSKDFDQAGIVKNNQTNEKLANIIDISSQDNHVYNDGKINYTSRYIQKSYGSIKQSILSDEYKTWVYKPVLLWEVAPTENTRSIDNTVSNQSSFVLGAMPLKNDLNNLPPFVSNNQLQNNIIDVGENIYWLTRYNGYFYANGEIIRYDAVEFNIPGIEKSIIEENINGTPITRSITVGNIGNVWITSVQEYQRYFSKLPFNGKMYPTGRIRIYSEPNYEQDSVNGIIKLRNGEVAKHGRAQFGTQITNHSAGLNNYWLDNNNIRGCTMNSASLFKSSTTPPGIIGQAGVSNELAKKTVRSSVIKNFLSGAYVADTALSSNIPLPGTIQSSALIMNGPSFSTRENPLDFVSYVYKPLNNKFTHFGTRARIIGRIENNESRGQTPIGSTSYYVVPGSTPDKTINIGGASGGLAVMVNPETNVGYYFEIAALTDNNIAEYSQTSNIANIFFYKIMKDPSTTNAAPISLWSGISQIIVDDGKFSGQQRLSSEAESTVYDLAVEYQDIGGTRRFYLYINNKLIAVVDDTTPLPIYNNMGLFVRGSSRLMFENIYAITNNYGQNTTYTLNTPINSVFGDNEINVNESFRKYALSGAIQNTYLSGLNPAEPPKYNIYYDEFGTIMREAAYFNIKYDKAYPALYSTLSPTFNRLKGYVVSGFLSNAYGAEFLVFNATDSALNLDETSGNYLRIQGVTFTQESNNELTVDDYFAKTGDFSALPIQDTVSISSSLKNKKDYEDIKISRLTYGRKEFSLSAPYIQSEDDARNLMSWIISKVMKPRKSVGVRIFGMPTIQLGDIVSISFESDEVDQVLNVNSRFVVYHIEYDRSADEISTTLFLSEVK